MSLFIQLVKPCISIFLFLNFSCFVTHAQSNQKYVDPFIGTGSLDANSLSGSNFPGACLPFGFVQLSPDTQGDQVYAPASGYNYGMESIVGFSHTHMSGTGISDFYDVMMMPSTGEVKWNPGEETNPDTGYRSRFSHDQEWASPGYYKVNLLDNKVDVELTATEHAGFHRYTFKNNDNPHIILDLGHTADRQRPWYKIELFNANIRKIDDYTIEGFRLMRGWARVRRVYFYAKFSKPFTEYEYSWGDAGGLINNQVINGTSHVKGAFFFDMEENEELLVKVGLSAVSPENAKANLEEEITDWDFDKVKKQAELEWQKELSNIEIEASDEVKEIFYTGLYHLYIQPSNIADRNGQYQSSNYTIRQAENGKQYSTFSLWDTYRAAHPLYTILKPQMASDFIDDMLDQYDDYGYLPIWQLWGDETYCMVGNPAINVVVDGALKKLPGIDIDQIYQAAKGSATRTHVGAPFNLIDEFGYIPENIHSQSVSISLENAVSDYNLAQLAKKLGKNEDYEYFSARSRAMMTNLFDTETGFFRGKDSNGNWLENFNPLDYGGNGNSPYTEGNAWQYLWHVQHDIPWLIEQLGGKEKFREKLDAFFSTEGFTEEYNHNASGFIGQYAHGNEPSHHIAYLYNYIDMPWRTQELIHEVIDKFYSSEPDGYSGNEDCGQMSSWYVFSSLGFYPVNPGNAIYNLGSPQVESATISLENGKTFKVKVKNYGEDNIYVKAVYLNGKKLDRLYITHEEIISGGVLKFVMASSPKLK